MNNGMFITFMLPSLEVLCSSPHKSQSLYVTLVVVFISFPEQNTKPGACTHKYMTSVAYCRSLSICCLTIVCCLDLVQTPQSMTAVVVMGGDTLSSKLVLNKACCMKVSEDRARTKPTPESIRVQTKPLVSLTS